MEEHEDKSIDRPVIFISTALDKLASEEKKLLTDSVIIQFKEDFPKEERMIKN